MNERRAIYDELSRVLTDYEGNGSDEGATASDLYDMLVKIQNDWEDVITAAAESHGIIPDWLAGTGPFVCKVNGYHNTVIRVRKNADFDYLYIQRQYHSVGIERGDKFEYAGIYCRRDGLVYDAQYAVRDLFDDPNALETCGAEALHKHLKTTVRKAVEASIANDRNNLRITELTSERELEKLANYQKYSAGEQARKAYLYNDDEGFDFTFTCEYDPDRWTEDSLLAYILDPGGYVNAEAKSFIDGNQETMLLDFLESDLDAAAYKLIVENPANPVHRVKRIIQALSASSAKTVTVTIRKDGIDFTFKAEAAQFRSDCTSYYNDWNIMAADRKEFERLFGRSGRYGPEDIIRIEYARSVLYEAEAAGSEVTDNE